MQLYSYGTIANINMQNWNMNCTWTSMMFL